MAPKRGLKAKVKARQKRDFQGKETGISDKHLPLQNEDDIPFDFGGLPTRDLKKNLGCG